MGKRVRIGLLIGGISALLVLLFWWGDLFDRLRLQLNDVYFLDAPVTDQVMLIAIDDDSLDAYGRTPVEWSRGVFADLVDILGAAQARVVAFDILFAQSTPADAEFAAAMRTARTGEGRTRFIMPLVGVEQIEASVPGSLRFAEVLRPTETLAAEVDYFGFVNAAADVDETVRRQPSHIYAGAENGYSFGLTAFLAYLRIPAAAFGQVVTLQGQTLTIANEHAIPVDARGFWRQNFFTPSNSADRGIRTVSFHEVIDGTVDPAIFADKVVMVGLMNSVNAPDERPTPLSVSLAGVEIHAHAVETLIQGIPLYEQSTASKALTIVAFSLLAGVIYAHLRWYLMLLVMVKLLVVWLVFAFVTFLTSHWVLNLYDPIVAIILPVLGSIGWQITTEINRRRSAEHWLAIIQRQKELLETVIGGSPTGIAVLDRYGSLNSANHAFDTTFDLTKAQRTDKHFSQVLQAVEVETEAAQKLASGLRGTTPFHFEFKHKGKTLMVDAAILPSDERWVVVFHDVSDLAELSEIKTHMIRMLSHDLKNPLATVIGFSELLINPVSGEPLRETQKRFVENIRRSAGSMLMIINETLSMEQLRSGRMRKKPVELAEVIQQVVKTQQIEIEQHRHNVQVMLEPELPPILGDTFQISQALTNLVSNAVKYTPDGGKIQVRLTRDGACAQIEIEDNGYGMSEAAQANLFKEFFRADATAHIRGTGLGLSLVKAITEAHGGQVKVVSTEGQGSVFTLILPLAVEGVNA